MAQATVDKKALTGDFSVVAVGPGARALYRFKDVLLHLSSAGPGMTVVRTIMPVPPGGGRVIAGSAVDPAVVTEDGELWAWQHQAEVWLRVGSPREDA